MGAAGGMFGPNNWMLCLDGAFGNNMTGDNIAPLDAAPDAAPCVLHIIPQDGIGGAEIAARSATLAPWANVHVHAMFNGLYEGEGAFANPRLTGNATRYSFSPRSIAGVLRRAAELNPDIFVFSLWRSFPAFVALKARYPDRKFVTFVHNERIANRVDRVLTALMLRGSDAIWVDSQATMDARLDETQKRRAAIISLRLERPDSTSLSGPAPSFIYWGRLAEQKRIDRAMELFIAVARQRSDASFTLIGPDHGVRKKLEAQAAAAGVAGQVHFTGPAGHDAIAKRASQARFFLQLSDHEGMAMGVVEALQLGLVPVVTPVGQMAVYCRDGENALIFRDRDAAAARLLALMDDPATYAGMSRAAVESFADVAIYVEDVAAQARALTERN